MNYAAMSLAEMSNPPARDFLSSSPALSLSLAGIFATEGTSGGGEQREGAVETSSENSGAGKSGRSDEEYEGEQHNVDDVEEEDEKNGGNKKRKKYHRHTPQQIREMEALFKESPHPDEKQRLQLSKQLGLHPRQVKFWFQNRRTQIKAIQERHENSLLKTEIDKLRDENKALRDTKERTCPNCGQLSPSKGASAAMDEQRLRNENARLKAEVEKLRSVIGECSHGAPPNSNSYPAGTEQKNRRSWDWYPGKFGLEKSRIMDAVNKAMNELIKMSTFVEPLWIQSYETERKILNYDEYIKEFGVENFSSLLPKRSIEASRESAVIFVDLPWLVQKFMDVNQWKELFPCLVSRAATVDVIHEGEGSSRNGTAQLMFAEIQLLTPLVPAREVYFVRYCKKVSETQWAIVDVSVDKVDDNIDASMQKCSKRPSGCIIEDSANGHCKVTWVEHLECQKSTVHSLYRTMVNSGLAFGAKHWISTLQQQCERLVFLMATNVPTKDPSGVTPVTPLAGRKSILNLAQRMTRSFCKAVGASSHNSWNRILSKNGEDIRVASRKNLSDPREPVGTILSATTSVWLPASHHALFDFLRDESRRNEWDLMSNQSTAQSIVKLAKGQDQGNTVAVLAIKTGENNTLALQDSCINAYEALVVYAHVDTNQIQSAMTGSDPSNIALLPSGFSILPDGVESRPFVITSKTEEKATGGGSLLTLALQILMSNGPTEKLAVDSIDSVNTLISCTVQNIKRSLQCED